mgnify:CR=1 FL=1
MDNGIMISNKDKTQHFVEQMYASGMFDVQQMQMWEKQPKFDKTWKDAKEYFEELINEIKKYELNSGGMAGWAKYKSVANIQEEEWANQGDEWRGYLEQIAASGNARNDKLQQMAETTANVVAMMTNFQKLVLSMAK